MYTYEYLWKEASLDSTLWNVVLSAIGTKSKNFKNLDEVMISYITVYMCLNSLKQMLQRGAFHYTQIIPQ